MSESRTSKYVVTELKMPESKQKIDDEYSKFAKRVLWMDDKVVEGAFHMNVAWYLKATASTMENVPHVHDSDEIIGFFSSDPADPWNLGGEVEIWLEDEKHVIDRSAMIFVPAGMWHCPLIITRVDRPIFHFTTVTGGKYNKAE
ncbi:MAG: hypothetical protein A2133_07675 [Actinobacteria bacterium RBG_16_64_13]|nr:MAG: hypothetical protein A2133_07675 [Actinobacteria bacterium RBG_16_64_13]